MLNRDDYSKAFGKYLEFQLKKHKAAKSWLAEFLGRDRFTISRWVSGESTPNMYDYYRIRIFFTYIDSFIEKYVFSNDLEKFETEIEEKENIEKKE